MYISACLPRAGKRASSSQPFSNPRNNTNHMPPCGSSCTLYLPVCIPPCRTEELGKGAFSVVKSATRKADGQKSAVKVVERRKLGKGDLDALRGEARLLGELDHPNIVKLHGWYEEDKTLFMALELCEGEKEREQ